MDKENGYRIFNRIFALVFFAVLFFGIYWIDLFLFAFSPHGKAIWDGKFNYIGQIINITCLVAAYIALCFAIFTKKKVFCGIVSTILVLAIIPISIAVNSVVVSKNYKEFDSNIWKYGGECVREYMIDDLEQEHGLIGMDIEKAQELLGEGEPNTENSIDYYIGLHEIYLIHYDNNGKITSTERSYR